MLAGSLDSQSWTKTSVSTFSSGHVLDICWHVVLKTVSSVFNVGKHFFSVSSSTTDWPLSFLDHMEVLSVKVPVSSSVSPPSGPEGDNLETSGDTRILLSNSTVGFGVSDTDTSFQPLLGHDSLMSERDSQADPDTSDTPPHSFEICPLRGPSDCTSSSFDIVFEDSGCDRDADADTASGGSAAGPTTLTEKNSLSSSPAGRQEPVSPSSSSNPGPALFTLAIPTTPPTVRVQPFPKVLFYD